MRTLIQIAADLVKLPTEDTPEPVYRKCTEIAAELRDFHDAKIGSKPSRAGKHLSEAEKEGRIDAFLAGWGGLKETREIARLYLEGAYWDVSMAQQRYWHEVILTHEYAL